MKKKIIQTLLLFAFVSNASAQVWTNLQNLEVAFKIKNAGINVDGKFTDVSATVSLDQKHFENSTFNGVIQAKSVNTDNKLRDGHLRDKEEFFNVAKYPTITMKALKVGATQAGGSYKVDWLITMKGVSKKVTTDVLVNPNGNSLYILTVFQLNRLDWKVGDKGVLMSDNVVVTVSGNLLR